MKQWRPENWDDIAPSLPDSDPYDDYCNGYDAGVEAGADAMLEALKKGNKLGYGVIPGMGFGWHVFIPDEESDGS